MGLDLGREHVGEEEQVKVGVGEALVGSPDYRVDGCLRSDQQAHQPALDASLCSHWLNQLEDKKRIIMTKTEHRSEKNEQLHA